MDNAMLSYDDAVKTILHNVRKLAAVEMPLSGCVGQVASENIYADFDLPQSAIASRDGYAVKSQDILEATPANPVFLRIIATARAGRLTKCGLTPRTAIRIMTGAQIPKGADCVVQFEDTDEPPNKNGPGKNNPSDVKICAAMPTGENIWSPGSNVRKGNIILPEGTLLGPVQISAVSSIGRTRAMVIRRPKVAIIDTGDELVRPGGKLTGGKIYSGNSAAVAALVRHYGGVPKITGIARDKETSLLSKIRKAMTADAIVTIGGISKGDYDMVRLALAKIGRVVFPGIQMLPSAAFSVIKRDVAGDGETFIPVFSLSGPPAACLINFETMVRPAILKMLGFTAVDHPSIEATALDSARNKMPMPLAMFTRLQTGGGGYQVGFKITGDRSMQSFMAAANSLVILPEGTNVKAGDRIQVLPLDWRRDQLFL